MTPPPLPSETASPALAAARRTQDFPSRLSPMLVKELRQGLRTHLFTTAFILFQSVMVMSLMVGLADPGSPAVSAFFWFFVVVALVIVQPLRGFNALSSEYLLNTMDLIQLTRLDAWRITLGKWAALNAQTLLFVTGVLPYVAIRYFLGNVNFVADLVMLLFLTLGSGLASAIMIGCSAFRSVLLRGTLVVSFAFGFLSLYGFIQSPMLLRGLGLSMNSFAVMSLSAITLIYGCFFFLSFGASRIAPPSENLATRKRLVALGMVLLALGFAAFGIEEAVAFVVLVILQLACIDALTEPLPIFAKVMEPFRRRALLRPLGWLLSPGWISGLFFFLFCFTTGAAVAFAAFGMKIDLKTATILLSSGNSVLFPLILMHLLFPAHASGSFTFGMYFFIQVCLGFLTMMVGVLGSAISQYEGLIYSCLPIPSVLLVAVEASPTPSSRLQLLYFGLAVLTLLLGILIPLLRQRQAFRQFRHHLRHP